MIYPPELYNVREKYKFEMLKKYLRLKISQNVTKQL